MRYCVNCLCVIVLSSSRQCVIVSSMSNNMYTTMHIDDSLFDSQLWNEYKFQSEFNEQQPDGYEAPNMKYGNILYSLSISEPHHIFKKWQDDISRPQVVSQILMRVVSHSCRRRKLSLVTCRKVINYLETHERSLAANRLMYACVQANEMVGWKYIFANGTNYHLWTGQLLVRRSDLRNAWKEDTEDMPHYECSSCVVLCLPTTKNTFVILNFSPHIQRSLAPFLTGEKNVIGGCRNLKPMIEARRGDYFERHTLNRK